KEVLVDEGPRCGASGDDGDVHGRTASCIAQDGDRRSEPSANRGAGIDANRDRDVVLEERIAIRGATRSRPPAGASCAVARRGLDGGSVCAAPTAPVAAVTSTQWLLLQRLHSMPGCTTKRGGPLHERGGSRDSLTTGETPRRDWRNSA